MYDQVNVSKEDLEVVFLFIDLDGSKEIDYREFLRKLKRSGVKVIKKEEELLHDIYKAFTEAGYTI